MSDSVLHLKSRYSLSSIRKGGLLNESRRQTKSSISGKSIQSNQVIHRSHQHNVETFGTLPVLVREALTFPGKNAAISVRVSNEGWAWFVCGRRLLIWQCKTDDGHDEGRRRFVSNQCRELTLPSSDLAYKAELVVVYTAPGNQVPSCMAVSPEGIIRYWPSITHEGSSAEINTDLQGQECDSFTDINPLGCVLATTTATIIMVQPQMNKGRYNIVCRPFKLSQGWLKGIGRLIPSLLFGSMQSCQVLETKLVKITVVKNVGYDNEWMLYILAGHTLQKWILVDGELERLIFECDINQLGVEAFQKTIWEPFGGNPNEVQVWLLDMQPTDGGVTVLLGGTNSQISPQFYYALGTLLTNSEVPPTRFDRFCPLKNTGFYRESDEQELLSYKFLISGGTAYLYKPKSLLAVSAVNFGDEIDNIDFLGQDDQILGGALYKNTPVLFSKVHGLVSVVPSDSSRLDSTNMSVSDIATVDQSTSLLAEQMNVTISDFELEDLSLSKDSIVQLKVAFLYFVRRNNEMAENIVTSLFPYEEEPANEVDSHLDSAVTKVALDIINDIPSGDPRWVAVKTSEISLGSSVSLQILNQLEDKQRALEWFITFLKEAKIWERLSAVSIRDTVMATTHVLAECGEKIVAAIALKKLQSSHSSLSDQCVKHVVGKEKLTHGLSHQDLFYREVSRIVEGLQFFGHWSENLAHSSRRPQEVAVALSEANTVFLSVIWEVLQWRKQKAEGFIPKSPFVPKSCEYLPWTTAPGSEGLRDCITNQHSLTLKYGARATGELELKHRFYEQLVSLTDVLLDGRRSHVNSTRGQPKYETLNHQYENNRLILIKPFLEDGQYEQAAILAEKYHDFHSLIQICELTDNMERLDHYCDKFSSVNFSQFLFNWYIKERKPGRLLQQFRGKSKPTKQKKELLNFLNDHPSLHWLQNIFANQYKQASNTLYHLAKEETELLSRKKTMLSLAKLSLLASEEDSLSVQDKLAEFDSELELAAHQEDLPTNVLIEYGYDVARLGVLTPSELIKLYICEENENVTEVDFKKALDLLEYVEDDLERSELRHAIWCNAILRDSWKDVDSDSPMENILNLFFFKLVDLVEFMGGTPDEFLPPIDTIIEAQELGELKNDRHFQYLIRVGYEHFQKNSGCPEQL
ncbi:hypothetical protein RUM44_001070 [Polyplax serrata]|uniref:Nuclear pore complex protein Nup133 n=1 Tax=Polyplax serrata TaxID=468196 RepID=A0ABR1B7L8_POLSC